MPLDKSEIPVGKVVKPFRFIKTIIVYGEDEDEAWENLSETEEESDTEWALDETFDGSHEAFELCV